MENIIVFVYPDKTTNPRKLLGSTLHTVGELPAFLTSGQLQNTTQQLDTRILGTRESFGAAVIAQLFCSIPFLLFRTPDRDPPQAGFQRVHPHASATVPTSPRLHVQARGGASLTPRPPTRAASTTRSSRACYLLGKTNMQCLSSMYTCTRCTRLLTHTAASALCAKFTVHIMEDAKLWIEAGALHLGNLWWPRAPIDNQAAAQCGVQISYIVELLFLPSSRSNFVEIVCMCLVIDPRVTKPLNFSS